LTGFGRQRARAEGTLLKREAPIFATLITGFLIVACAPTAPVAVPGFVPLARISPIGLGLRTAQLNPTVCTQTGGTLTLNLVPFVSLPFSASSNQTPQPDTKTPVNLQIQSDINSDLTNAFSAAQNIPNLQTQLCHLGGIFIDPSGCQHDNSGAWDPTTCNLSSAAIAANSWGLRTYPPNSLSGQKYIGLSLGLWNNKNPSTPNYQWSCQAPHVVCAPPFSLFYAAFLDAVIHAVVPGSPHASLFSVTVMPDTFATNSAMSALAVLAHEFGHTYLFDSFVVDPNTGLPNPGGSFVNKYFCNGNFYSSGNWGGGMVNVPSKNGRRWLDFGDISPNAGPDVRGLPGTLHNLYHSGDWADVLAAFSPDEDFVETFELFVLWKAGLTTLEVTSNNGRYSDFIIDNGTVAPALANKIGCFL
jgi:hypothetical protein